MLAAAIFQFLAIVLLMIKVHFIQEFNILQHENNLAYLFHTNFNSPDLQLSFPFIVLFFLQVVSSSEQTMDLLFKGMKEDASECPFDEKDFQRCPFLKNIIKPTCFSFSSVHLPLPIIPVSCLFYIVHTHLQLAFYHRNLVFLFFTLFFFHAGSKRSNI